VLERNEDESKYSPLISTLLNSNRYLKYDENDCKYYIDETTYKLKIFEERYSVYAKQLNVLLQSLKYYGYTTDIIDSNKELPLNKLEELETHMKKCKYERYDQQTNEAKEFLNHIDDNNIDMYRALLKGNYSIFKDEQHAEERGENNLYVNSIEIMEKNLPIILSLYKYYTIDTIKDIYDFCTERNRNRINYSKLERIRTFVRIESNIQKSRLDFPMYKFVREAQKFATENPKTTTHDINVWISTFAAKYANSIENLVVQDIDYLETVFNIMKELFAVVVVQKRPSKGSVSITPFELTWERKDFVDDIYGTKNTKEFFLAQLIDEMKSDEESVVNEDEVLPDLEAKPKLQLKDVEHELPQVIHKQFNYMDYSTLDGSNERFLRKQRNTDKSAEVLQMQQTKTELEEKLNNTDEQTLLFSS
jgi:hypothetical protein